MRSYTNKSGELVKVSEKHLDTAVRIKKELQNASPSRKCSWSLLVKMMEREGFSDADNNESYRCMIKAYQKSVGELPEAPKYASMVADSKLESIKELVGEVAYEKRENQHVLRELNKVKRDVIDFAITAEQIGNAFKEHDFTELKFEAQPINMIGTSKMVVSLSDLHIGAVVDTKVNKYDYSIAIERMQKYLNKIIAEAKVNNISDVYVVNLGDTVEHSSMRFAQGYKVEFAYSEQIVRASDLIQKFLIGLSQHVNVTYAGIAGNHDRVDGDKNKGIDGDHAVKAINYAIEQFIENAQIDRIAYVQAEDYKHSFNVGGKNILALHGDLDNQNDVNLLAKHSKIDGIDYDLVLMGHTHTRFVKEVHDNKFISVSGSLKGADDFTLNKLRKVSSPSQSYHIIREDGEIEVRWVTFA
ncbi:metallophosphatase [Bacillus phage vB_BanS-Thrax1]|nr:metallophosphatase [Bacillus phage vB_BanS-Thrax1]